MLHKIGLALFNKKCCEVIRAHDIDVHDEAFVFSEEAILAAQNADWGPGAVELTQKLSHYLSPILAAHHAFVEAPYVRRVELPDGKVLNLAIVNQQSAEWYGAETFVGTCDFLLEGKRGLFDNCFRFIDLGGHQMVWATYYALTNKIAVVKSFEPSVLNCLIGLYNCLMNDVIDRVEVIPYAVSVEATPQDVDPEGDKMLVDFLTVPLKTCHISEYVKGNCDFIKIDIEGYEYELLFDPVYVDLIKNARHAHFELHLGHLIRRGIDIATCVKILKKDQLNGTELYSQRDMYEYLQTANPNSYPAFVIS